MLITILLIVWLAFPPVQLPDQPTASDTIGILSAPGPFPECPPICPAPPPGDSD